MFLLYCTTHLTCKYFKPIHKMADPVTLSKIFRPGKYVAFFSLLYMYYQTAQWYFKETKRLDIYDYLNKRQNLKLHWTITRRMWQYAEARAQQVRDQISQQNETDSAQDKIRERMNKQ